MSDRLSEDESTQRSDERSHEVTLAWRDGRSETIGVPDGLDVVTATEREAIRLPFGCRTGVCGTCTGRLLSGTVTHVRPPRALKERHLADGYVLPCVATPTSDATIEVGANVHDKLLKNPWQSANSTTDE